MYSRASPPLAETTSMPASPVAKKIRSSVDHLALPTGEKLLSARAMIVGRPPVAGTFTSSVTRAKPSQALSGDQNSASPCSESATSRTSNESTGRIHTRPWSM